MKQKNLYLITSPNSFGGYDTYSAAVVVANSKESAKLIHPNGTIFTNEIDRDEYERDRWWLSSWVSPDEVSATLVGRASPRLKLNTVVCASFHAG